MGQRKFIRPKEEDTPRRFWFRPIWSESIDKATETASAECLTGWSTAEFICRKEGSGTEKHRRSSSTERAEGRWRKDHVYNGSLHHVSGHSSMLLSNKNLNKTNTLIPRYTLRPRWPIGTASVLPAINLGSIPEHSQRLKVENNQDAI